MPARRLRDAAHVQALTARLLEAPSGRGTALSWVVEELRSLLGAESVVALCPVRALEGWSIADRHDAGLASPDRFWAGYAAYLARQTGGCLPGLDVERPRSKHRNRAVLLRDLLGELPEGSRAPCAPVLAEVGMADRDVLRVLLHSGSSTLAWVAAFRREPFGHPERALLAQLVRPLRRRLRLEQRLKQAEADQTLLEAALEAIPSPAFLLSPEGRVHRANELGKRSLDTAPELAGRLREALLGGEARRGFDIRSIGAGGAPFWLITTRADVPSSQLRLAHLSRLWNLTPRQREVLQLVVDGQSNKEIADRLSLSVGTVELHVSAILQKAGASSRMVLSAKVWAA